MATITYGVLQKCSRNPRTADLVCHNIERLRFFFLCTHNSYTLKMIVFNSSIQINVNNNDSNRLAFVFAVRLFDLHPKPKAGDSASDSPHSTQWIFFTFFLLYLQSQSNPLGSELCRRHGQDGAAAAGDGANTCTRYSVRTCRRYTNIFSSNLYHIICEINTYVSESICLPSNHFTAGMLVFLWKSHRPKCIFICCGN